MEPGRDTPRFFGLSCPEAGPEGWPRQDVRAGMFAGPRCDLRAEYRRVVTCERARDPLRNSLYFSPHFSASLSPEIGHHHDQDRAVLDIVKALAALDPAGCGLDDACAQLGGSSYVMADEARLQIQH